MKVPWAIIPPPACCDWRREVRERHAALGADDVLVAQRERILGYTPSSTAAWREQLAPQLGRGGAARIADREGGPAALGAEVERRRERVGGDHADVRQVDRRASSARTCAAPVSAAVPISTAPVLSATVPSGLILT